MSYFELKPMSKEEIEINSPKIGIWAKIEVVYKNINNEIKTETYSADQKEFDLLIKKIYSYIEINNIEIVSNIPTVMTNSIIQKAYSDSKVEMDDNTKKIFENNLSFERSFQPSQFRDKPYYKEDNLFPIDYIKLFLPIPLLSYNNSSSPSLFLLA